MSNESQNVFRVGSDLSVARTRFSRVVLRILGTPFLLLSTWWRRALERKELAALDDRILKDVGLTREQVASDFERPFGDPLPPRSRRSWLDRTYLGGH